MSQLDYPVYPNLANNIVNINFSSVNSDKVEITFYNLLGEIIRNNYY